MFVDDRNHQSTLGENKLCVVVEVELRIAERQRVLQSGSDGWSASRFVLMRWSGADVSVQQTLIEGTANK